MSAPSRISSSFSVSSMAACLPTSGRPPEPSPLVSWLPIWILRRGLAAVEGLQVGVDGDEVDALDPGSIIRLTALPPPPPMPMTLILAPSVLLDEVEFQLAG